MKKVLFMLMLTAFSAIGANAQVTALGSATGLSYDTLTNAGTIYFTVPANSINAATTGKFTVAITATKVSGTSTFSIVLEGTVDGTNWFRVYGTPGADGINCDTLTVTNMSGTAAYKMNITPGAVKTVYGTTYYTAAVRCSRLRVRIVGTGTQVTRFTSVRFLSSL